MIIACLLLMYSVTVAQTDTPAGDDLKAEVRRLIRQLDAPQLADRDAAEVELLKRGPAILDLLPAATERTSAEVKQRLGRVRQKLQRAAADAAAQASTIALHADAMPLSKALAEFQKQSGNTIVDYREKFGQPVTDPTLKLNFDKTPFWQALDQLLDQAELTVYPFSEQSAINVVAIPPGKTGARTGQAFYRGPFRFEPERIVAKRDFHEADGGSLQVTLGVAWEPRLKIISLMQRMADVQATDERGKPLPVADGDAQLEVPAGGDAPAVKLDLPFRLPPRDVQQIANLKGKLTAMIPGKIETFRFARLGEAKNVEQRIAGVTVTLEQVRKNNDVWEVRMRARFDDAGDALASHRTWIFDNEAYLEGPGGKPIPFSTYETTLQGKNEVGVAYLFGADKPLKDLTFVYKTPGTIVSSEFEYELREIKLP